METSSEGENLLKLQGMETGFVLQLVVLGATSHISRILLAALWYRVSVFFFFRKWQLISRSSCYEI
jgi:hypothetical protein